MLKRKTRQFPDSLRSFTAVMVSFSLALSSTGALAAQPVGQTPNPNSGLGALDPSQTGSNGTGVGSGTGGIGGLPADPSGEPGLQIPSLPTTPIGGGTGTGAGTGIGIGTGTGIGGIGGLPGVGGLGANSGYYPPNSPYSPWSPYNNYGNNWRPGMIAIETSMVPGVVCPLVDNRPQVDILTAVNNLFNYVLPDDNCYAGVSPRPGANSSYGGFGGIGGFGSDGTNIGKQMLDAGTQLNTIYKQLNDGTLDPSTMDLGQVQSNIAAIVSGLDKASQAVANNPLVGRCENHKTKAVKVIQSIGDVVSSLAPFALILAAGAVTGGPGAVAAGAAGAAGGLGAAGAAMGAVASTAGRSFALKAVLGTYALGSVAKVYGEMIETHAVDMEKPDQREALLQNLCEYFRIEQRVNFLKLADMKQLESFNDRLRDATVRLNEFQGKATAALKSVFPAQVLQLSAVEDDMNLKLKALSRSVLNSKREMAEVTRMTKEASNQIICSTGTLLVKEASVKDSFTSRILTAYNDILKKQTRVTLAQRALISSEGDARKALLGLKNTAIDNTKSQQCAEISKGYILTLEKIIGDSEQKIKTLQNSLETQLGRDPAYKEFKNVQLQVKKEVRIRESTSALIAALGSENSSIVYKELNQQMDILKRALMGRSGWTGKSPVRAWLENNDEHFGTSKGLLKMEIEALSKDAVAAAFPNGRYVMALPNGRSRDLTGTELTQRRKDLEEAAEKFKVITPAIAPVGSENQQNICRTLQRINLRWHTTMGDIKSEQYFCKNIQNLVQGDALVEPGIVDFCFGKSNVVNGRVVRKSEVEQNLIDFKTEFSSKVKIAGEKFRELKCDAKDSTLVVQ